MWIEFDNALLNLDHISYIHVSIDDNREEYAVVLTQSLSQSVRNQGYFAERLPTEQQAKARYNEIKTWLMPEPISLESLLEKHTAECSD